MKKLTKTLCAILLSLVVVSCGHGDEKHSDSADKNSGVAKQIDLRFNREGSFKIAQFTDIHWNNRAGEACEGTENVIRHVLSVEKPDLVVLTGDIVNDPVVEGWAAIVRIFEESAIPWAVVLGNHDDEFEWSREQIIAYLLPSTGFVGELGPEISGAGNYVIPISGSATDSGPAAVLYFIDAGGYPSDPNLGKYDWVKYDQIQWYKEQSRAIRASNNDTPLPALLFLHIPLPEYKHVALDENITGHFGEEVCSPDINSGLFAALLGRADVMGVFCGHDHENNFIGSYHGIALAYGQVTGISAYGSFERGARIISLHEGHNRFTSWIRTMSGKSDTYVHDVQDN